MYLLAGMLKPKAGKITWNLPAGSYDWGECEGLSREKRLMFRRQYFGFAFQKSKLIPHMTVEENLLIPLLMKGIEESEARHIVDRASGRF